MEEKKTLLTYAGLKKLEEELHELKVNKRQEVAQKIKEAREQGDLSVHGRSDRPPGGFPHRLYSQGHSGSEEAYFSRFHSDLQAPALLPDLQKS